MKKKYLVTVNGDRYIWQKVDDCLNENEKESLLHEAVRKSLEKRLQVIFRIIYIILIGSAILLCSVLFISGMITVDQAISLIAGVFAFFFSICVVLNDYNKVKFENIFWYSVISTMLFLIVYLLLAPQITLSENLQCFRLINIGNTLTFLDYFFRQACFTIKKEIINAKRKLYENNMFNIYGYKLFNIGSCSI